MSDLSDLKKQIAAAFSPDAAPRRLPGRVQRPKASGVDLAPASTRAASWWVALSIALAGLMGAAVVVTAGSAIGLALLLAGVGVSAAFFLVVAGMRRWKARRQGVLRAALAVAESAQDQHWQMSEGTHLLASVHDALGDIALICDPSGRIINANAVFQRLTGHGAPEGLFLDAFGLDFTETDEPGRYRVEIVTDAGLRIFDWHDVLVRDGESGAFLRHSIARDVTAHDRMARDASEARLRAEAASRAKSQLLATVSHEIRTPLSGILGMSHLIGQTRLTSEQKSYLDGMRQSGHALVQLVDDLLDFASIEAGRFQLRPAQEPLRDTMERVVEMLAHRAHEKGIEIGATVAADVPGLLEFDTGRLRQVLFNIVGNAVKFTEEGGVLVRALLEERTIVIRVEDTGPGMDKEEQDRIFEAFEQAGGDAQRAGGTGLGLPISRRIMEAFGGSITVDSRPGRGTTFEIRFPAIDCDPEAGAQARRTTLSGSHVLVMAPNGPAATALSATITTLGGVCTCAPTREAARTVIDMVLSGHAPLTDIIVDHRHAAHFRRLVAGVPGLDRLGLRRTYLVNPEERSGRQINRMDGYQAWLIRPLRERSLIEVLKGRMKGMEVRDAINDNRPILRDMPATVIQQQPEAGILLAEDDPINALMVRAILERAGHKVQVVASFDALRDRLFKQPSLDRPTPALIVTDVNMPGGDGVSMLREMAGRRPDSRSHVPVIALTSDDRSETRDALLQAGASAVFTKPADPRQLTETIDRLLQP